MKLPPAFANLTWAASNWRGYCQFRRALAHPADAQLALLRRMLARHAESAYGRAHDFAAIRSYEDFAQRVPLVDYEDIEPWIRRIQHGEPDVLTSDPVNHLIPTSGSVRARKFIPFTTGLQADFDRAIAPWISGLFRQQPDLAFGPAFWSISPAVPVETDEPSAVPVGFDSDSCYLGGFRQCLVDSIMAAPAALRLVSDMDSFRYLTLLCLLRCRELRLISVWHASFLSLLLDALPRHWDELLNDILAGSCHRAGGLPPSVGVALRSLPMPERTKELQHADPRCPETLWPSLRLISCWRDAHAEFGAQELQRRFPNTFIQPKGLLATEAFVTIPFAGQHPVAIRSHFFEFIDEARGVRLAHELRAGESYDVVVTTSGGLWRYRMHDRVEVTGFVERTPSLRFLGRSGNVSDYFGEKLSETFVGQAIRKVTATQPLPPRFAMLAPEEDESGWRYTLYLEGSSAPDLGAKLDTALRENFHYAWCRDLGQLREVRIVPVESGYRTFIDCEMKRGRRLGEIKPVPLSASPAWAKVFGHVGGRTASCSNI